VSILEIIQWPDPKLCTKSAEVKTVDKTVQKLMDDMLETMHKAHGIGLAAVQIGVLKRVIVIDLEHPNNRYEDNKVQKKANKTAPLYLINPKIIDKSKKESIFKEGCLSFPNQFSKVTRPEEVTVEYLDYYGIKQKIEANGLLATCIQHEIDHIDGLVFIDHISKLKRNMIVKKLEKNRKLVK
jgi:peptide deformylase